MVSGKSRICCVKHASYQDRANMKGLPPEVRKCGSNVMISTLCCAVRLLKPKFSDINVKFSLYNYRSKWVISPPFFYWVWFETKNGHACTLLFSVTCSYLSVWLIKRRFSIPLSLSSPPPLPPPHLSKKKVGFPSLRWPGLKSTIQETSFCQVLLQKIIS